MLDGVAEWEYGEGTGDVKSDGGHSEDKPEPEIEQDEEEVGATPLRPREKKKNMIISPVKPTAASAKASKHKSKPQVVVKGKAKTPLERPVVRSGGRPSKTKDIFDMDESE